MHPSHIKQLFLHTLKDLYSGEKQLISALPALIKVVANKELQMTLREDLELAKVHVSRIESVCAFYDEDPAGENCNIIEGLLEEFDDSIEESDSQDLIDLNVIGICQKIRHFQLAGYGSLCTFSKVMGEEIHTESLQFILDELQTTENRLSRISENIIMIYAKVTV
jgi:ferritin-like metal-binding protein YciE